MIALIPHNTTMPCAEVVSLEIQVQLTVFFFFNAARCRPADWKRSAK